MKTITGIGFILALAFFAGCEGVPGPPGEDGEDGDSFLGVVFEIEGDFTAQYDYKLYFEFPDDVEVYDTDVVLVYILWEQAEDNYGELLDVWRLLPQTVPLDEGLLQYNYDYTFTDVQIFMEGSVDLDNALPAETLNQIFRIVILPAKFAKNNNLDVTDFSGVMNSLKLNPNSIQKITP